MTFCFDNLYIFQFNPLIINLLISYLFRAAHSPAHLLLTSLLISCSFITHFFAHSPAHVLLVLLLISCSFATRSPAHFLLIYYSLLCSFPAHVLLVLLLISCSFVTRSPAHFLLNLRSEFSSSYHLSNSVPAISPSHLSSSNPIPRTCAPSSSASAWSASAPCGLAPWTSSRRLSTRVWTPSTLCQASCLQRNRKFKTSLISLNLLSLRYRNRQFKYESL